MKSVLIRRYDEYVDSEIEWLDKVPSHWEVRRLKDATSFQEGPGIMADDFTDEGVPLIRLAGMKGAQVSLDGCNYLDSAKVEAKWRHFKLQFGDLLVSASATTGIAARVSRESVGAIPYTGLIRFRQSPKLLNDFLQYFLVSSTYSGQINYQKSGTTIQHYGPTHLKRMFVAIPPLHEQLAIARYLDAKTAQIDRKIELLTQKAAKYRQLKQSIINAAVTRGLDQSVPMKDSGVEWIGELPAHWGFKRLKDAVDLRYSNVDKLSQEGEVPIALCNYVDVYKNDFIAASLPFMAATANATEIKRFSLRKDDVLVTKDSETADDIAVSALVLDTLPGVLCGYHLAQLRGKPGVMHGPYLFRLFQSNNYGHRFATHAKGITRVGLSMSVFADALTPIPPFEEQIAISQHIDAKSFHIDGIVSVICTQIDKLKDLRKSLINDVVTGKLRVT